MATYIISSGPCSFSGWQVGVYSTLVIHTMAFLTQENMCTQTNNTAAYESYTPEAIFVKYKFCCWYNYVEDKFTNYTQESMSLIIIMEHLDNTYSQDVPYKAHGSWIYSRVYNVNSLHEVLIIAYKCTECSLKIPWWFMSFTLVLHECQKSRAIIIIV